MKPQNTKTWTLNEFLQTEFVFKVICIIVGLTHLFMRGWVNQDYVVLAVDPFNNAETLNRREITHFQSLKTDF